MPAARSGDPSAPRSTTCPRRSFTSPLQGGQQVVRGQRQRRDRASPGGERQRELSGGRQTEAQPPDQVAVAEQPCDGALVDHHARLQGEHAVGADDLVHLLGHVHHGEPLGAQVASRRQHLLAPRRVQHRRGLVQDEHAARHGEHAGERRALLLASGEQVGLAPAELGEPEAREHLVDPRLHLRGRPGEVLEAERHVVLDALGHQLVLRVLEEHADVAARAHAPLVRRAGRGRRRWRPRPRPASRGRPAGARASTCRSRWRRPRRRTRPRPRRGSARRGRRRTRRDTRTAARARRGAARARLAGVPARSGGVVMTIEAYPMPPARAGRPGGASGRRALRGRAPGRRGSRRPSPKRRRAGGPAAARPSDSSSAPAVRPARCTPARCRRRDAARS